MLECLKIKKDGIVRHFCKFKILAQNNAFYQNLIQLIDSLFIYKYTYV